MLLSCLMCDVIDCRHIAVMPRRSIRLRDNRAEDDNQGKDPLHLPHQIGNNYLFRWKLDFSEQKKSFDS